MRDDLGMQISRIVVASLERAGGPRSDDALAAALRAARSASAEGHEVVYLGASDPRSLAWAARAEDARGVRVVADAARLTALHDELAAVGLHDVDVSLVDPT